MLHSNIFFFSLLSSILMCTTLTIAITNSADSPKSLIQVGVYYSSLCPFSRKFIMNQVIPVFRKLSPIINLKMIPFGNSYITINNPNKNLPDVEIECQHGHRECLGNKIQSCSLECMNQTKALDYINCIFEHKLWFNPKKSSYECAEKMNITYKLLTDCYESSRGIQLQLFHGNTTRDLVPPHVYVPWLTINGQHDKQVQKSGMRDLAPVICSFYKGLPFIGCTTEASDADTFVPADAIM